jgi:hypothetical protein
VNEPLSMTLPDELVDAIAERVASMLVDRRDEDGWLRGAEKIASYIDAPRSRVFALSSARRIPVHKDGSALVAKRSELDAWMQNGGGSRP